LYHQNCCCYCKHQKKLTANVKNQRETSKNKMCHSNGPLPRGRGSIRMTHPKPKPKPNEIIINNSLNRDYGVDYIHGLKHQS